MIRRRNPTYRLITILLLALALSPFTPPFSTFDLALPAGVTTHEGASLKYKVSSDPLIASAIGAQLVEQLHVNELLPLVDTRLPGGHRQFPHTILRL